MLYIPAMATAPTKQQVNARLPSDLIEWMAAQDGSQTDVIVRALRALKGDGDGLTLVPVPGVVAELEAKVASLTEALAKSRKVSQSLMPMADRKPEKASGKLVADVLPVTGDQFPEQETWWQRQQRIKARGKAG